MGWKKWRRVPESGACDWCLMLATRGAVYASKEIAKRSANGKKYHSHCHCGAKLEESFDRRKDVAIKPEDAGRFIEYKHNESGKYYRYQLDGSGRIAESSSSWLPSAPKVPKPDPVKPTPANAAARESLNRVTPSHSRMAMLDLDIVRFERLLVTANPVQREWALKRLVALRAERAAMAAELT